MGSSGRPPVVTCPLVQDQNSLSAVFRREVVAAFRDEVIPAINEAVRRAIAAAPRADPDRLIDSTEAAALLGMTSSAVRKAAQRGSLPALRIGRRLRFRVGDLLARGR